MLGIVSIAVFTLVCVMLIIPMRRDTLASSVDEARLTAELASERLAVKINASASILTTQASAIAGLIESNLIPANVKRQTLMNDLKTLVLSDATAVTNIWIILEPNILDDLDSLYINQPGCTDKGVLSASWNSFGKISNADYDLNNNLYRQVKQTRQVLLSQPYQDENVWIITALAPIIREDIFAGVIATDYNLLELCDMVRSLNTIGEGKLVTDKAYIAAHSFPERIGVIDEFGKISDILDNIKTGKKFEGFYTVDGVTTYKVYVPVKFATSANTWYYAVDVTHEKIYEDAKATSSRLIMFCIIGVILISIFGNFMVRPMLNSVINVTNIIRQLSLGRINLQIDENRSKDELGTMKTELHKLLDGLKNSVGFAKKIGEGNLTAEYRMLSDDDALGSSLLEMCTSLQKAEQEQMLRAKEEEQRNWGTAGLAKFAEILQHDNNDMETLSYNIISNMVKYLGINQGGIFVMNDAEHEEDRILEMKACYAFDRKKFIEKQIRPGEGLVGTCYLEGEPIYMTKIPNEYITITSGLGDANPRALLISPLKVNKQIFGVIELASFQPFEAYHLDFVQKVCESIAATISSVNVNIRTNRLLTQTKLQTEEMANKEEELRQNMEEMQATQEESHRHEVELQEILVKVQATQEESHRREVELQEILAKMQKTQELNEANQHEISQFYNAMYATGYMVEYVHDLYIRDINQNLLDLFDMKKSDVVGKHITQFIDVEIAKKIEKSVTEGVIYEDTIRIKAGDLSKSLIVKFVPIRDKNNKLLRIVMLAFVDETNELRKVEERLRQENKAHQEEIQGQSAKLNMTMYAADIGLWDMMVVKDDPVKPNNTVTWTEPFRNLLGYAGEAEFPNVLSSWSDKLHPEDKEKTLNAFAAHLLDRTGKKPFDGEFRLIKKNGEYGWFKAFGETTRDEAGNPIKVTGGFRKITKEEVKQFSKAEKANFKFIASNMDKMQSVIKKMTNKHKIP